MTSKEIEKRVDMHETAIQLTNQKLDLSLKTVTAGIDDIKASMVGLKDSIENGFVTKQEFTNLKEAVADLQNYKSWAIKIVLGAVIVGVLALLGLPKG